MAKLIFSSLEPLLYMAKAIYPRFDLNKIKYFFKISSVLLPLQIQQLEIPKSRLELF